MEDLHTVVVENSTIRLDQKVSKLIADGWIPYGSSVLHSADSPNYPWYHVLLWRRESKKIVTEPSNPCEESHVGDAGKPRNTPEY